MSAKTDSDAVLPSQGEHCTSVKLIAVVLFGTVSIWGTAVHIDVNAPLLGLQGCRQLSHVHPAICNSWAHPGESVTVYGGVTTADCAGGQEE